MKNFIIASFCLFMFVGLNAQTRIGCTGFKEIQSQGGYWGNWPAEWNNFAAAGMEEPVLQIAAVQENADGEVYHIQLIMNGQIEDDLYVAYDWATTSEVRQQWGTEYVNAYVDENGDFVYMENVSLTQLAQNASAWGANSNAHMYIYHPSQGYAMALR